MRKKKKPQKLQVHFQVICSLLKNVFFMSHQLPFMELKVRMPCKHADTVTRSIFLVDTVKFLISMSHIHTDRHTDKRTY